MGVHGTTVHQRVVTEYWVASDLALPHNPLIAFLSQLETALAQTDRRFAHRTEEALRPLVRSTALRVVVHAESRDEDGKVERKTRTLALTALERGTVDAARLAVPAGYTRRDVDLKFGFCRPPGRQAGIPARNSSTSFRPAASSAVSASPATA